MIRQDRIMDLLPLISEIKPTGNYMVFKARTNTEIERAQQDITQIRSILETMGVTDIPAQHTTTLEVNYQYADPTQKKILDTIILKQKRFKALQILYYNGGIQPTTAETEYFTVLKATQIALQYGHQNQKS